MTKNIKDRKAIFQELLAIFKDKVEDRDGTLYERLYEELNDSDCLDKEYHEHIKILSDKYSPGSDYSYDVIIHHVNEFSFDECCSMLTFIIRAERWSDGWFNECLANGDIYRLLSNAYELIYQES